MSYVAIKGGQEAIEQAANALEYLRTKKGNTAIDCNAIETQLHFLHGRVLSEGGLYNPELASLAIKQSLGDPLEAAFFIRAYRSTKMRTGETPAHDTSKMRLIRRISSAFKDIPGGQMLGPTTDYIQRLFRFDLLDEHPDTFKEVTGKWFKDKPNISQATSFPKVVDALRAEGLLPDVKPENKTAFDITREPLVFPAPRSAALQTMARGETGSLLAIAYSNMRGYGDVHPTIAELRVGYLPIEVPHPVTGELIEAGEVLMTECEVVAMYDKEEGEDVPMFGLGYGACFGHNEVKAIAMAILDRSLQMGAATGARQPSQDSEFVLLHIDGIESSGFCSHYKMPHYVTFQSDMDRLRETQKKNDAPNLQTGKKQRRAP